MKKFTKIMLILAGILSVIGIVLCAAGILLGGSVKTFVYNTFVEFNSSVDNIEDASFTVPKGIFEIEDEDEAIAKVFQEQGGEEVYRCDIKDLESLSLSMGGGIVTFIASDRYDVRICVNSQYLDVVEFQNEDGELEVEILQKKRFLEDTPILIVQMPKNYVWNELDIELKAGQLVANELCAEEASITVQAGKVDIGSLGATEADLQVKAGAVEVGYLDAVSADIECNAGTINILKGQIDEDGDIACNAGSIKVKLHGNPKDYNYDFMVSLGHISLNGEKYTGISGTKIKGNKRGTFDISCNVGAIELDIEETTSQTDTNKV